jgi:hypothetical protein
MKTRRGWMIALSFTLLVGTVTWLPAATDEADSKQALQQELQVLLNARVLTARRCVEATQAAYKAETVLLSDLLDSMTRLRDAELALAITPFEELAALKLHVERVSNVEKKIKVLFDMGSRGGEANQWTAAKTALQSAEIEVLKARIKMK